MYGCENWTAKKAECRRIDAFELWYWRTPESPLDCKEIKQVNPKGNYPWIFTRRTDAEAEAQYFGHLRWRAYSMEKTLMLGKTEGKMRRGWQKMRWLKAPSIQRTWVWANSRRQWRTEKPGMLQPTGLQSQTQLSDWTTTNGNSKKISSGLESGERSWWIGGTQRIFRTMKLFCMIL